MKKVFICSVIIFFIFISLSSVFAGGKWYNNYNDGLKQMKMGNWSLAISKFDQAIKLKNRDVKRIKTYGMHFIKYFPHREKGICFYN